jgi:hypothetical protein
MVKFKAMGELALAGNEISGFALCNDGLTSAMEKGQTHHLSGSITVHNKTRMPHLTFSTVNGRQAAGRIEPPTLNIEGVGTIIKVKLLARVT